MTGGETYLVDSHAHLDFEDFVGEVGEVVRRAREAGVERIVTIGTSYGATLRALEIAGAQEGVSAAGGIHPNYAADKFEGFAALAGLFDGGELVGVGETGLDFYREHTPRGVQVEAFKAHVGLALEKGLPLIIHVREAYEETFRVLDGFGGEARGVFHCFSGTREDAREALARGFFVSVAGQVTFKNAEGLREVVAGLPLERLLVETDCPYLAPAPKRGKRNEPAYVRYTAEKIAEVMGVGLAEVARATSANALELFGMGEGHRARS